MYKLAKFRQDIKRKSYKTECAIDAEAKIVELETLAYMVILGKCPYIEAKKLITTTADVIIFNSFAQKIRSKRRISRLMKLGLVHGSMIPT